MAFRRQKSFLSGYTPCTLATPEARVDSGFMQIMYDNAPYDVRLALMATCKLWRQVAHRHAAQFDSIEDVVRWGCIAALSVRLAGQKITQRAAIEFALGGCSVSFAKIMFHGANLWNNYVACMPYMHLIARGQTWFNEMMSLSAFKKSSELLSLAQGDVREMEALVSKGTLNIISAIVWFTNGHNGGYASDQRISAHIRSHVLSHAGKWLSEEVQISLIMALTTHGCLCNWALAGIDVTINHARMLSTIPRESFSRGPYSCRQIITDPDVLNILAHSCVAKCYTGTQAEKCTLTELICKVEATGSIDVAIECEAKYKVQCTRQQNPRRIRLPALVTWLRAYLLKRGGRLIHHYADYYSW